MNSVIKRTHQAAASRTATRPTHTTAYFRSVDSIKPCKRWNKLSAHAAPESSSSSSSVHEPPMSLDSNSKITYERIKSFGVAGVLSYVLTELAFWALAIPTAIFSYHESTGTWLSIETDRVQLVGIALGFVTAVRFFVPLRMGAAFALIPFVQKVISRSPSPTAPTE